MYSKYVEQETNDDSTENTFLSNAFSKKFYISLLFMSI